MLNLDFINRLYKALDREKKHQLLFDLFGPGRQSLSYFRRTNDTSLSKVETMAHAFGVPVDALLLDSPYTYNPQTKTIEIFGFDSVRGKSDNVDPITKARIAELEKEITYLKEISELKDYKLSLLEEKLKNSDNK